VKSASTTARVVDDLPRAATSWRCRRACRSAASTACGVTETQPGGSAADSISWQSGEETERESVRGFIPRLSRTSSRVAASDECRCRRIRRAGLPVQPTGRARIALRLPPLDQAVSRASLAQASISTVVPPATHLPLGHRHTRMSERPFIGYLSRRILSTVQRPVRRTSGATLTAAMARRPCSRPSSSTPRVSTASSSPPQTRSCHGPT